MKKSAVLLTALMLAVLLLAGCGAPQSAAFVPVELPEVYKIPAYIPWDDLGVGGDNGLIVTQKEALADFDYMWAMLEQNAPFLQMVDGHAAFLGFDYADVVQNALKVRGKLEEEACFGLKQYALLLQESFGPLAGRGHLNVIWPYDRSVFLNTAEWAAGTKPAGTSLDLWSNLQRVLTARKVQEAYAHLEDLDKAAQSGETFPDNAKRMDIHMTYAKAGRKSIPVIVIPTVFFADGQQTDQATALLQSYMRDCLEMEHQRRRNLRRVRGNRAGY